MVYKKYVRDLITTNGRIVTPVINGKIIKVVAILSRPNQNVRIKLFTGDFEEVVNTIVQNEINIYYPFNDQIAHPTPEERRVDYFYSSGSMGLEVTGISPGYHIKEFRIIYEE
jgi:hypothetical protein